ncbi:hypothetical protein ACIP5N_22230 [Streptomyces sp. NPDC088768]|uniref:hypothetical protein n=1 Tax=Streptomyces sp. NPDC088768 TaxID=3365894 RepID=UPI0038006947
MTPFAETSTESLVAALRTPVLNALCERADALRRVLPARPGDAVERPVWWQGMTGDQQRQAALLEHLDALCGHLAGRPAPGCSPDDPMPLVALEEADGFTSAAVADLISAYRAARARCA